MDAIMQIAEVAVKWKKHRDTLYKFITYGKGEAGIKEYQQGLSKIQEVIKAVMVAHNTQNEVAALLIICEEVTMSGMEQLKFVVAAYELAEGNDFTNIETEIAK